MLVKSNQKKKTIEIVPDILNNFFIEKNLPTLHENCVVGKSLM